MAARSRKKDFRQMMEQGRKVSGNIVLCADGKYRWTYELSLWKDASLFLLVWKIIFFVLLGIFALMLIMDIIEWGWKTENVLGILRFFLYFIIGMTALLVLGYSLYALIMGGKYKALFEMDEQGINHVQLPEQAQKAKIISALTVLAGLFSRRVSTVGVGLTSARTEMYSEFSRVREVKAYPSSHLIKVNGRFMHNRVYAAPEDLDFVLDYITSRCPDQI
ncbi:MAG: hypothetical protein J5855_00270 [Mailhella sp.]|nr:hypothetical protein [Mailhella sp.]